MQLREHNDLDRQALILHPSGKTVGFAELEGRANRLAAFVVLASGAGPLALPDELRSMVRDNLARHKVPRSIKAIDELPRNPAGKVCQARAAEPGDSGIATGIGLAPDYSRRTHRP